MRFGLRIFASAQPSVTPAMGWSCCGIDRGEIDSHGRDLSKKMPAGCRHRVDSKLMARAEGRTTAESTRNALLKSATQSASERSLTTDALDEAQPPDGATKHPHKTTHVCAQTSLPLSANQDNLAVALLVLLAAAARARIVATDLRHARHAVGRGAAWRPKLPWPSCRSPIDDREVAPPRPGQPARPRRQRFSSKSACMVTRRSPDGALPCSSICSAAASNLLRRLDLHRSSRRA